MRGGAALTSRGKHRRMSLESRLTSFAPHVRSILRIVAALIFMAHGTQKLLNFPAHPTGGPEWFTLSWTAGVLELFGGALLVIGLWTRPTAFVLSGLMAFAYFIAHAPRDFYPVLNGGDAAILYCFVFLYFVFAGGGPLSVDAARRGTARA
jgi:putative oxidoreductase